MSQWIEEHPVLTGLMVLAAVGGGVAGVLFLPEGWGLTRRILGGVMSGIGVGIILLGNRMLGAYGEPDADTRRDIEPPTR